VSGAAAQIEAEAFFAVDLRVARVVEATLNPRAHKPAYVLRLDLGHELGERISSAQLTALYTPEQLVGRLVVVVLNLPPRRVAGVRSEVLVLAAVDPALGAVLLEPGREVAVGTRVG
jgi:tRNA-binding protein